MDEVRPVGRPPISPEKKKGSYGLNQEQLDWLAEEALKRNVSVANMLRHIVDWYRFSLNEKRAELLASTEPQQQKLPIP